METLHSEKKKNMGFFLLNVNKAEEKICEVKLSTTVICERERERERGTLER